MPDISTKIMKKNKKIEGGLISRFEKFPALSDKNLMKPAG